jgi:hypothetical protein
LDASKLVNNSHLKHTAGCPICARYGSSYLNLEDVDWFHPAIFLQAVAAPSDEPPVPFFFCLSSLGVWPKSS